jgi:SpoIIAA-like
MIEFHQIDQSNIIEFTIDGEMSRAEFDAAAAKLDGMMHEFGKIRIIEIIKDIGKIEPAAIWADLKWEPRHINNWSHIAVVADQKWIRWMKPLAIFIPAKIKFFHLDELEDARAWIGEDVEVFER